MGHRVHTVNKACIFDSRRKIHVKGHEVFMAHFAVVRAQREFIGGSLTRHISLPVVTRAGSVTS